MINFQKSRYSAAGQTDFTINLAIAAKRILRFDGEPTTEPPLYYSSHWDIRIKYKSILLAERGELKKLPALFNRMEEICRRGPGQAGANEHIALLTCRYLRGH